MTDLPSSQSPTDDTVNSDIDLIIGGSFTVDAIGPDRHGVIVDRLQANPDRYLDVFDQRYLGVNFDPLLQSRLHSNCLLDLLVDVGVDQRVRATGDALLRSLNGALVMLDQVENRPALEAAVPEETVNTLIRLEDRRRALTALADRLGDG